MFSDRLETLAKLLAQAERAGTEEEADAARATAQKFATTFSLDVAMAQHINRKKGTSKPVQRSVTIGVAGTEGKKTLVNLYLGIAQANDLQCLIACDSTRVYPIGFEEDHDIAEALYASLLTQMTALVEEYRKEGSWRDEEVWAEGWYSSRRHEWIPARSKRINWRTARLNFQQGFADRIAHRLWEVTRETRAQRIADEQAKLEEIKQSLIDQGLDPDEQQDTTEPGTALVLASKREQVRKEYQKHLPKRSRSGWDGSIGGQRSNRSRGAGRSAADRASLGSSTSLSGANRGITR